MSEPVNNFDMLDDNVLLEVYDADAFSAKGIYLVEKVRQKPNKAKVLKVGPGKRLDNGDRIPVTVKVGDEVLCSKSWTNDEVIDNVRYRILPETEIWAKLEK